MTKCRCREKAATKASGILTLTFCCDLVFKDSTYDVWKYVTPSREIYLNLFLRFENRYMTFHTGTDFDPFQGKEILITVYVVALLGIIKNENTKLKKKL